jgi:hypothetical protein
MALSQQLQQEKAVKKWILLVNGVKKNSSRLLVGKVTIYERRYWFYMLKENDITIDVIKALNDDKQNSC